MRWFKHYCDASDDEKIAKLEDEFGLAGYAVYFKLLELFSSNFDGISEPKFEFSFNFLRKKIGIPTKKLQKIVVFSEKLRLFSVKINSKSFIFEVPNLLKIKDEYSKKKLLKSGQSLQESPDNVPSYKSKSKIKSKNKSKREIENTQSTVFEVSDSELENYASEELLDVLARTSPSLVNRWKRDYADLLQVIQALENAVEYYTSQGLSPTAIPPKLDSWLRRENNLRRKSDLLDGSIDDPNRYDRGEFQ